MNNKIKTLDSDEKWIVVGIPRELFQTLITFLKMEEANIPQSPITNTGRLRSGATLNFGRAIGNLLLEYENNHGNHFHFLKNTKSSNTMDDSVGVPIIVKQSDSFVLFDDELLYKLSQSVLLEDKTLTNENKKIQDKIEKSSYFRKALFILMFLFAIIGITALFGLIFMPNTINQKIVQSDNLPTSDNSVQSDKLGTAYLPPNNDKEVINNSSLSKPIPMSPPHELEVVLGRGGKRLFVFSDPLCPYCKRLEPSLVAMSMRGYEVHIFPTPIHKESVEFVEGIACAKDKATAWFNAINKEIKSAATCAESKNTSERALAFFRQFGFNATPTLINDAGKVKIGGFESEDALAKFVEEK